MQENKTFMEWLGVPAEQMYGFVGKYDKNPEKKINSYSEEPLEPLEVSLVLDELGWLGPINNKKPKRLFENVMSYGDVADKMQVVVSPYGSLKIILRKVATTLEGNYVPLCYSIYPLINDYNHNGVTDDRIENIIANKIADKLQEMDKRMMLSGQKGFEGTRELVLEMAQHVRANHPRCMHFEGVIQSAENDFTIYLQYNGQGVEAPSAKRVEQFDIHVNYDKNTGLIRCWGNEISSPTRQHLWQIQPSEWDEYFSPKQKNNEIVECIMNALYTY
jgi:hypothetical protein